MAYSGENCAFVYPIRKLDNAAGTLLTLAEDVGIPNQLFTDSASLLTGPKLKFVDQASFLQITLFQSKPLTQRQNEVEKTIGLLKRRWKNQMSMTGMPKQL